MKSIKKLSLRRETLKNLNGPQLVDGGIGIANPANPLGTQIVDTCFCIASWIRTCETACNCPSHPINYCTELCVTPDCTANVLTCLRSIETYCCA